MKTLKLFEIIIIQPAWDTSKFIDYTEIPEGLVRLSL
jgi:hypothetical protein